MKQEAGRVRPPSEAPPTFNRVLSLWALVLFGLAFVGPTAPFTFFGVGSVKSRGHFALVYLIAMVAVSFTAFSYGRMSAAFPEAGSTYAYAARALHPLAGFFAGWIMILDYILMPMLCVIIVSASLADLVPILPYPACVIVCATLMTATNLSGIKTTSRVTFVFNLILAVAILWFVVSATRFLVGRPAFGVSGLLLPFFDPKTFSLSAVMAATPIAVLSFLGFDGISTLAEDAQDPQKNIGRATLLVCLIASVLFIYQTWLAQLVWPDYARFPHIETAFAEIGRQVGGQDLYYLIVALVVAQAWASGITSQASASRLLFAMSRDGRLPYRFFGYVHPVRQTPVHSLLLMGGIAAIGAILVNLDQAAQLVNYGACIGFMAVNAAVFGHYYVKLGHRRGLDFYRNLVAPLLGLLICFYIWLSISRQAMIVGIGWSLLGLFYLLLAGRSKLASGDSFAIKR